MDRAGAEIPQVLIGNDRSPVFKDLPGDMPCCLQAGDPLFELLMYLRRGMGRVVGINNKFPAQAVYCAN